MTSRLLEMCPYYFLHVPVFPIAKQPVFIEYECVFLCRNRTQAAVMKPFLWITSVRRFETFLWDRSSHQILPAPTDFTDHWIVLNKSKKTHLFFFTKCKYYFLDMPQVLTSPHVPAPRAHRTRPFFRHISACSNRFDILY